MDVYTFGAILVFALAIVAIVALSNGDGSVARKALDIFNRWFK